MEKFTQEIKDNWLTALKSGKYTQGYTRLNYKREKDNKEVFCCIGVLGDILEDKCDNPYDFLNSTIGWEKKESLWRENDKFVESKSYRPEDYKDDYSNVIPLIEALEVQE